MRLITWNLNHRAARRHIPQWIETSLDTSKPDVVILTEYVEGPDHDRFIESLARQGLATVSLTERIVGENQLLIASRESHQRGEEVAPNIHRSVLCNALHVRLSSGLDVLGFRMPAFEDRDRIFKRETWNWLHQAAGRLLRLPAVIVGDFNTAIGDSKSKCGDCLEALAASGWERAPANGRTWKHRCIDHAFVSSRMSVTGARCSWDFQELSPDAKVQKVGLPDHAMIIVDCHRTDSGESSTEQWR